MTPCLNLALIRPIGPIGPIGPIRRIRRIGNTLKSKAGIRGYILLETVVAMGLLSIGMIAIQGAMRQAIIVRGQARDAETARHLLEEVISNLELQHRLVESEGTGDGEGDSARFHWTWKISKIELPAPPIPQNAPPQLMKNYELKAKYVPKIEATVTWSRSGRNFKATAQTLWYPAKLFVPKPPDDQQQQQQQLQQPQQPQR